MTPNLLDETVFELTFPFVLEELCYLITPLQECGPVPPFRVNCIGHLDLKKKMRLLMRIK
jgi:hypothetical protein